jgi:hypothetical protein
MEELTRYGPSSVARAGGGTPPAAGRRSSGGCRLRGRGAAMSMGGARCGEGSLRGRSKWPVHVAVLGGHGSAMGSTKRRTLKGILRR